MNLASVQVGELKHRLTLQFEDPQPDGQGGYTPIWTDLGVVWASVQPISGQEALVARQLQDSITHKVRMRWRPNVKAAMRLKWGTRLFNIRKVSNLDEGNVWLELRCEEGVAT